MFRTCPVRFPAKVDVVGQLFPYPADLNGGRGGLAELALGPDLTGYPCDFGDKSVELVDHGVDRVLQVQHLAPDVGGDLLAEIAVSDRPDHTLHLTRRAHERLDQAVDRIDAL